MRSFLYLLLVCVLLPLFAEAAEGRRVLIGTDFYVVPARVVDGDTFKAGRQSIRLWGFDTPEHYQRYFFAAAARLEELITAQRLKCHVRDIDRYRRPVAQCWLPDGRDVGAEMVASGLARDYTRYSKGYYKRYESQKVSGLNTKNTTGL